jgi:pimeloyl-ACP methyl ester carboxylesterase
VHYVEHGQGTPVLVLHGAGVDHREALAAIEPVLARVGGHRRIYPDLPGMGHTPAPPSLRSADDVLEVLLGLVDALIGTGELLLVGHSAGAYFARAMAAVRPQQVVGLAVVCPVGEAVADVPAHRAVRVSPELATLAGSDDAGFRGYFVVQTPDTLERYRQAVAPAIPMVDAAAMERVGERWRLSALAEDRPPYPHPVLVVAGRQDSTVGYAGPWQLLERYPRATFAVLDRAGHALLHEQAALLAGLVEEWLSRVAERTG